MQVRTAVISLMLDAPLGRAWLRIAVNRPSDGCRRALPFCDVSCCLHSVATAAYNHLQLQLHETTP